MHPSKRESELGLKLTPMIGMFEPARHLMEKARSHRASLFRAATQAR